MLVSFELRRQLVALLRRNLLLKRREFVQTIFEVIVPVAIYVAVSLAFNSIKPVKQSYLPPNTTIEYEAMTLDFNGTYSRPGPVLLIVNTKYPSKRIAVYEAFRDVLGKSATVELVSGSNSSEVAARSLKRRYLMYRRKAIDKNLLPVGVVIDYDQPVSSDQLQASGSFGFNVKDMFGFYSYQIVLASPDLPPLPPSFADMAPESCLPDQFSFPVTEVDPSKMSTQKCSALYYTKTDFLHLQNAVHRAILKVDVGMEDSDMSNSIKWQMLPRTTASETILLKSGDDITSTWASFTVYLAGLALINLFSALVSGAVTEKEKGVRETMLLMGMNSFVWKSSWFIVYFAEIFFVSALVTMVSWLQKLVSAGAAGVFFVLLTSYGFSLVSFGLLLITAFNTARGAATATSFVFVVLGLPYMIVRLATMFSKKAVPTAAYYLLSFLFPFAFQRGLDLLLEVDRGLNNPNSPKDITVWGMILMLVLDGCVYLLIGLLVDYLPGIISDYKLARNALKISEVVKAENGDSGSDSDELARNVEHDPSLENRRAIVISNLTKTFHRNAFNLPGQEKPLTAVDNLSLTIYGGQITCLLGHNGAGKTTLIRILTGSLKSYTGAVNIFNWQVESSRDIEELRRDIGVCAQQNTLFDNLTVAEHLSFVLEMKSDLPAETRESIVDETMALVNLNDRANTNAARLSGGEKRKLCLAMAIIAKPRLLFLDEPTAGVDVYCRRQIWDVLTQYKQADRVVLLTTHYMDEADMLADRKALMHRGRLYSAGSSMFLRQRFGCGYRLTVELDPNCDSSKIDEITHALRAVMPSIVQMESERSRNELVYALPTGEGNMEDLLSLLRFLESDQTQLARYGVLCYGWSIATLDEVFMKLEEEVAEQEESDENHSSSPPRKEKTVFFQRKNVGGVEVAEVVHQNGNGHQNGHADGHSHSNGNGNGNGLSSAVAIKKKALANGNGEKGSMANGHSHIPPPISFQGIDVPEESPFSMRRHYVAILYLRLMLSIRNVRVIIMRFFFPIIIAIIGLAMSRLLMDRFLPALNLSTEGGTSINKTSLYVYQPFIYANVSAALTDKLKETMMKTLNADETSDLVGKITNFAGANGPFLLVKNMTTNGAAAQMVGSFIDLMTGSFMSTAMNNNSMSLVESVERLNSKIGAYFEINDEGIQEKKLLFSHTAIHALPSLLAYSHSMEAARQGYMPVFLPFLQSFSSVPRELVIQAYTSNLIFTLLFGIHVLSMLPSLGYDIVHDRETGCATQVKLAGISKLAYWLGSFTVDAVEYAVFLLFFLATARIFGVYSLSFPGACYTFLIYVLLVVPANVLMIYCFALFFKSFRVFQSVVTMVASMTGFFPFLAAFFWSLSFIIPSGSGGFSAPTSNLRFDPSWQQFLAVLCFLFPAFNAAAGVFLIAFVSQPNIATSEMPIPETSDFFSDTILRYVFIGSSIHIIMYSTIIFIHENWMKIITMMRLRGSLNRLLRQNVYLKSANFCNGNSANHQRPDEDNDVATERQEVYEMASDPIGRESAPYVCEARKVYTTFCRDCQPVEPKVAVEDVSFKLNYGQVFGLLGPNGAGKTTLIKLLIGSEMPNSGSIFSSGVNSLGYCPQESVLWDQLSGEEHIFIYSYARGFSAHQRRELAKRLSDGLGISTHLEKQSRRMSGGTKRKLCVALSLLGRPSVLCLDEPSAGMDPGSKRFLWRVVKQIFANQTSDWKIAALITTHHLDEAEALCHRIAIMVNGVLRCIGSRQHLKTKYGRYYTLEVKLGSDQLIDARGTGLIEYIDKLLPEALPSPSSDLDPSCRNDREAPQMINNFGRHFVFRIPSCRVRSLAKIFADLEAAKQNGSFASYSFSQVSLEQIFIQFAKEQYED